MTQEQTPGGSAPLPGDPGNEAQTNALVTLSDRNVELERELTDAQEALETREHELLQTIEGQTQELEMLRSVGDDHTAIAGQRDRLWHGLFTWHKSHARGCALAQGGGFCVECAWVMKLLKAEKGTPIAEPETTGEQRLAEVEGAEHLT